MDNFSISLIPQQALNEGNDIVCMLASEVPHNTTSICDSLLILKDNEHALIFMLGMIVAFAFVILIFTFFKIVSKYGTRKND